MARLVVLDSGPLGLGCSRPGTPGLDAWDAWLLGLEASGAAVLIPVVVDYEVRRELVRVGAAAKLRNLDALTTRLAVVPVSAAAWRLAYDFWALVRRAGVPTAAPEALDADCLLAATASLLGGPGDAVTIATTNVGHLRRFPGVDAQFWQSVGP